MEDQVSGCHCINCRFVDDLLVDVFVRLPSAESVALCKCVCKRWFDLTSNSDFISRFIALKIKNSLVSKEREGEKVNTGQEYPLTYFFLFSKMRAHVYKNFGFESNKFFLSFVPGYDKGEKRPILVNAWDNDLILCANSNPKELNLYLCNPRTKDSVHLPPPSRKVRPYFAGLICDPYYRYDKENGTVSIRSFCRYCICYCGLFAVGQIIKRYELEIFYSETGFWRKAFLLTPKDRLAVQAQIMGSFTYNNMLHFYWPNSIVCFDPYNIGEDGIIPSHFIMTPWRLVARYCNSMCLGVYGRRIRFIDYFTRKVVPIPKDISQVSIESENDAYKFKVWELKNYNTGEWSLEFIVYQHELVSEDFNLNEQLMRGCPNAMACRMHPYDPDIVIMGFRKLFAECNLRKKTLEPICRVATGFVCYGLSFPWWPSPLT